MSSIEEWLSQPGGLADRLRGLRAQAGLSGKELAEAIGWQPSKVSRLENGRQLPTHADIEMWAGACGADADVVRELTELVAQASTVHRDWRRRMRHGQTAVQAGYNQLVNQSQLIRYFELAYIPGFLQTPDYARRVLAEMVQLHGVSVDDVEAAVSERMRRQQALYDPAKRFEFLLAEPVLRWSLCPPDTMRAQLDRLQTVVGLPNVRFGILPLHSAAPLRTAPQNSFQLYDDTAVVETFVGETVHREDAAAAAYAGVLESLWRDAVTGEAARRLIIEASGDIPTVT